MQVLQLNNSVHMDNRGSFVRIFDSAKTRDVNFLVQQTNISINPVAGTLRGMHFQVSGPPEWKLITVLSGSIFLNVVNLKTLNYGKVECETFELDSIEKSILVPAGYATGWLSTSDNTSLIYQMSARFEECSYSGFRYDDQTLEIKWPFPPRVISQQDSTWPFINK
jgi:dTDP-4-dehydrorhamnose 3,5-epimerase